MRSVTLILLLALVCSSYGSLADSHAVLLRERRDIDILRNTRKLIEELVANLRKACQQARDAVGNFASGLEEQGKLFKERVLNDLNKLRQKVNDAIQNITDRFVNSGAAVRECITSHRNNFDVLMNDTIHKTMDCADRRIEDIGKLLAELSTMSKNALEYGNEALNQMKNCTEVYSGSFLSTGTCLGNVALQMEMKGAMFMTQIGFKISRINLAIATLPASLELCAGARLVEAGVGTAKILMNIASCSTSSVFSNVVGTQSIPTASTPPVLSNVVGTQSIPTAPTPPVFSNVVGTQSIPTAPTPPVFSNVVGTQSIPTAPTPPVFSNVVGTQSIPTAPTPPVFSNVVGTQSIPTAPTPPVFSNVVGTQSIPTAPTPP